MLLRAPSAASPIDGFDGRWWVVHTKPRHEKAMAKDLESLHVRYFLPLTRVRRQYGRRIKDIKVPLFPGYLFLCGGTNERHAALGTRRAANVLEVLDQDRLRNDLRHIQTMVSSEAELELHPGIRRGRRCRLRAGSLRGLEGTVLRRRGKCRVCVAVEVLGQSAEMEVDPSLLEVID